MININRSLHAFKEVKSEQMSKSKEIEEIKEAHKAVKVKHFTKIMSEIQSFIDTKVEDKGFELKYKEFQNFLDGIEYKGPAIASLSQEEAVELVSEDGFFGIKQTSERISQFVVLGAQGNEELLREGRKGIMQGLEDAEKIWGGKLPDIAYETIKKAIAVIDNALSEGGFSVLDEKA